MGVGENEASLPVDYDPGAETGSLVLLFIAGIQEVFEERVKETINALSREGVVALTHRVGRADVDDHRAGKADRPDNGGLPIVCGTDSGGGQGENQMEEQRKDRNSRDSSQSAPVFSSRTERGEAKKELHIARVAR